MMKVCFLDSPFHGLFQWTDQLLDQAGFKASLFTKMSKKEEEKRESCYGLPTQRNRLN